MAKKLTRMDDAFAVLRHITEVSTTGFYRRGVRRAPQGLYFAARSSHYCLAIHIGEESGTGRMCK